VPDIGDIRVLTWNIFHAHDGHPDARPTWASTALGEAVDSGTHLHLNRTLVTAVGRLLERARPHVAMLQEVPPWAVGRIGELSGMSAISALTAPRIGPAGLRGRLGRMNPDLFRTHEGNANALLVRPPWAFVPGSTEVVRLNPPGLVRRTARNTGMPPRQTLDWLWERRNLVTARIRHPDCAVIQVACCHCHSDPRSTPVEIPRAAAAALAAAGPHPLILAGDLNATVTRQPAVFDDLASQGLHRLPTGGEDRDIDHILIRGLTADPHARRWTPEEHEIVVPWKDADRRIRVSDHDPLETTVRAPSQS
jgi:Endonuclease/Exonuclease/phosphatase family